MKKFIIALTIIALLALFANHAQAGTLDRGVYINPFFIASGAYGNPYITQLKYQMAVDSSVGISGRYTTINYSSYNYDNCSFDTNNTGTFNTFESTVSGGSGDVIINNTYQ